MAELDNLTVRESRVPWIYYKEPVIMNITKTPSWKATEELACSIRPFFGVNIAKNINAVDKTVSIAKKTIARSSSMSFRSAFSEFQINFAAQTHHFSH